MCLPARRSSKPMRAYWILGALFLVGAPSAVVFAQDLLEPFALDNADTLPRNVRNPHFITIFGSTTSRYGSGGAIEGLGEPLNKLVTWKDVLQETEDEG